MNATDTKLVTANAGTTELFDALTVETYFGMNMRLVIQHMSDSDREALRIFINSCRLARQ